MKVEPRCLICASDRRDEIHEDYLNNHVTQGTIAKKYFSDRKPKSIARSLATHFRDHFNVDKDIAALTVAQHTPAVLSATSGIPMPQTDERVYSEYVRNRLATTATLEEALRNLMEKINYMEDEWVAIHQVTKCGSCGRDDNKETLGKMLALFKELREMYSTLMKVKNPIEIFKRFFDQTFIIFADRIMELYMEALREKGKMINEAINQYLRQDISAAYLSRRVAELEDMGAEELQREVKEQFKRILQSVRKEMDSAL